MKDINPAEDLVQDAFITFLEQKERISSHPIAVKSFLYTTVKHSCLNRLRHDKVVDRYHKKNVAEVLEEPKILEGMVHAEVMAELYEALNSLPPGCAMVLKYGYLEGLQNHKIAEIMNVSVNTVKSQKQRALNLIRLRLGDSAYLLLIALFANK